jgi:pimeloyl-ACP methyl ester carboxylesterase
MKPVLRVAIVLSLIVLFANCEKDPIGDDSINEEALTIGEHTANIGGAELWYLVRGEGPVLLIYPAGAGWGGDVSIYYKTLQPLEEYRKVVYFEPRGLGKSYRLVYNSYSMGHYIYELENFIDFLGLETFDLVGHCYGGCICLKYAINNPDKKPDHLILLNTTSNLQYGDYETWEKSRPGYDKMVADLDSIDQLNLNNDQHLKAFIRAWAPITFFDFSSISEIFYEIMDETVFSSPPNSYFTDHERLTYDVANSLQDIDANTLIIVGDDDIPAMTIGSDELDDEIPNSKLIIINDCGHWSFIEQPTQFFSLVESFILNE